MTQWGLDTLFNPAKRHMDDEKRRLQSTREEAGDSSGGKRIDLASGKVVIRRDGADDADGANGADGTNEAATDDAAGTNDTGAAADASRSGKLKRRPTDAKENGGKSAKSQPSAAAVRAAKRRGRTI